MKKTLFWQLNHIVHHCIAHPLLPIAEALDLLRLRKLADVIFTFHDVTMPDVDSVSETKYL